LALKKQHFAEGKIPIFDEACIYKRGEYWQFRMWLPKENKYALTAKTTSTIVTKQHVTASIGKRAVHPLIKSIIYMTNT
jgi:hypothetical protein